MFTIKGNPCLERFQDDPYRKSRITIVRQSNIPTVYIGAVLKIVRFILLSILSVLILMLGMPNVELGRLEYRNVRAFKLAQQIKTGELPADTEDPWGQKFDIQYTPSNVTVVTSHGSNGASPADGFDSDDISTSMSNPPHKRTRTRKQIQTFATLALSITPWLISFALRLRKRNAHPQRSER
ncbi:hypothetical protein Pan153_24310 [Gimesia panareensis]|uniref:Uncharacterized protein n=1 Tax=Gimesia panareensis TaxID=2527978 RepID=A0A518FN49_9PLAN|nr:hypothetical protein [Gimesia panareensis]QDV17776.1 hypothetical protein Pan153_24310 [Gimesia panareensis]